MKAICITGNSQPHIDELCHNLVLSGLKEALPSKRDPEINLRVWHEHVLRSQPENFSTLQVGKLWDQMAVDIFLANRSHGLWHWSTTESLRAAEYWLSFDPGIHFLLVYTPYEDYVCTTVTADSISTYKALSKSDEWCSASGAIFDLHERYPERTTLINSRTIPQNYAPLLSKINNTFCSALKTTAQWHFSAKIDPILNRLVRSYAIDSQPILEAENKSAKYLPTIDQNQSADDIISSYLAIKQENLKFSEDLRKIAKAAQLNTHSQAENAELISELESENQFLISQLHEIQEVYENQLLAGKITNSNLDKISNRLENILQQNPHYWECNDIIISPIEQGNSLEWLLTDAYISNTKINKLSFKTSSTENQFNLCLDKSNGASFPLSKLPNENADQILFHHPSNDPSQTQYLNNLGPSDWSKLNFLLERIIGRCEAKLLPKSVKARAKNNLLNGAQAFYNRIQNWPLTLRYDEIQLSDTIHIGEYQSIGISLKNINLGHIEINSFDFRLATVNEAGKKFGMHPRLEFPESTRQILQSWFPESTDERGARLELRFSQPNQMDTNIWSKLSGQDQIFISALISNLKNQVLQISRMNPAANVAWKEWCEVADFMKVTLSSAYSSKRQTKA
ncbi:hypothetical protein F3J44_26000 [Pantoea sp. Tr-811]|uniref:hypothetical protein n=1 Tax=Pantoea sp. Tr-811 TaxID=2608361 RepID=UPI0014233E7D|nr:hypothetical protein [Pantoea sp. Tr-811]NIF29806.1 hypothetical protein [Pantoea sp. Tr-811]